MKVDRVQWLDVDPIRTSGGSDAFPGCDGVVFYEVTTTRTEEEMKALPAGSLNPWTSYLQQPFSAKGQSKTPDDGRNVWAWDGNRDTPTLSPSLACEWPVQPTGRAYIHIYLRGGKISDAGSEGVVFV